MKKLVFLLLSTAAYSLPCPSQVELEAELARLRAVREQLAAEEQSYATIDRDIELLARINAITALLEKGRKLK